MCRIYVCTCWSLCWVLSGYILSSGRFSQSTLSGSKEKQGKAWHWKLDIRWELNPVQKVFICYQIKKHFHWNKERKKFSLGKKRKKEKIKWIKINWEAVITNMTWKVNMTQWLNITSYEARIHKSIQKCIFSKRGLSGARCLTPL